MTNPTKVCVTLPTFYGADYLGEAIQSVLDQNYLHFELAVVNHASRDNTTQIIDRSDDPRLNYFAEA